MARDGPSDPTDPYPAKSGKPVTSAGTLAAGPELDPLSDSGRRSSTDFAAPPELTASGQYTDVRELGRGGMGVVYLARNVMMNRMEVLKVVNKTLLDYPGAAERFAREIRSAAKLLHPNVVAAYSAQQVGDLLVLAMEYVEGEDLAKLVKRRGPLPIPNACYYVYQAAIGLQHAHEKGMVHRDIKPSNLILTKEGKKQVVKILDFGLAKGAGEQSMEDSLLGAGKLVLCTPDYVSPEQIRDSSQADGRSDIYSLGCTLYHLLTGRVPFIGQNVYEVLSAHKTAKASRLTDVRADIPESLSGLVAKMMAKDPAHRFQTPAEVAQALKPFFRPGLDVEVIASQITLTPVANSPVPEPRPVARPTRAVADESTPAVRPRPRLPRRRKKGLSTRRIVTRFVAGFLVLALFIAWAAGAFKSKPRDAKPESNPPGKVEK
jgi:serine/threonine protein kinase